MFRHLRTYRRIAQIDHHCDRCQKTIKPGDEYEGTVEVRWGNGRKKQIHIWKEHVNPDCDYPDFPDEDWSHDEIEEDLDLKKAA